jgi:hypothetical protein
MKYFFLLIFFYFSSCVFAQYALKGNVNAETHQFVDYFHVQLSSPEDSTFRLVGTFTNGSFNFSGIKSSHIKIKISSMGYKDYIAELMLTKNNDTISAITLKSTELKGVVVTAQKPAITTKADRIIVRVEGSILGDSKDGLEMLRRTPGLKDDGSGNVSVAGKENTIFYINGRRINAFDEVKNLNPNLIKSIEIIDNPSAAYDAEGQAVVLIQTKRQQHDVYSVQIEGGINQSNRITEWGNIETVFSGKRFSTDLFYDYTHNANWGKEQNYTSILNNNKSTTGISNSEDYTHSFNFKSDFEINKKQSISLQLDGYYSNSDGTSNNTTEFTNAQYTNFDTHLNLWGKFWKTNGTLNYVYNIDTLGQKLIVITDFSYGNSNYGTNYFNQNKDESSTNYYWNTTHNNNFPFVYSAKADYTKPINKSINIDLGLKYYSVISDSRTDLTGSTTLFQHYVTKEQNLAGYVNCNILFSKKLSLSAGVRIENISRQAIKDQVNYMDTAQLGLFPSAQLNYNISVGYSAGLSYSKHIRRPSFSALDPSIYRDSLFTRYGNPNLQSTDIHTIQLSLKFFNDLSLRLSYNRMINPYYSISYSEINNPILSRFEYLNQANANRWIGTVIYNKSILKSWNISLTGTAYTNTFYYTDADGKEKNNNTPNFMIDVGTTANLPFKVIFDGGIKYDGGGSSSSIVASPDYNVFFSLKRKFMKDALNCTISVNDLFYTTSTKQQSVLYGRNINMFDWNRRYIELSIKYKFGKSSFDKKIQTASAEERSRL